MLTALTRIFTTKICPTCSKAVHRSKLDTHLRRHAAGLSRYRRWIIRSETGDLLVSYWKRGDGSWALLETQGTLRAIADQPELRSMIDQVIARLNGASELPNFTKRQVPDSAPIAPVLTPVPNTLI